MMLGFLKRLKECVTSVVTKRSTGCKTRVLDNEEDQARKVIMDGFLALGCKPGETLYRLEGNVLVPACTIPIDRDHVYARDYEDSYDIPRGRPRLSVIKGDKT